MLAHLSHTPKDYLLSSCPTGRAASGTDLVCLVYFKSQDLATQQAFCEIWLGKGLARRQAIQTAILTAQARGSPEQEAHKETHQAIPESVKLQTAGLDSVFKSLHKKTVEEGDNGGPWV